MYNSLKSIAKNIIPQKVLIKNEYFFRRILIPFYKGTNEGKILFKIYGRYVTFSQKQEGIEENKK